VSLPAATDIGYSAFAGCIALVSVSLPAAADIGYDAFRNTGTAGLTVTLGAAAPNVGVDMFDYDEYYYGPYAKSVTVLVPSDATGYGPLPGVYSGADTATNWGNAFRGIGWDGSGYLYGAVNPEITVTIKSE
jgi:hypothetical protein